MPATLNSQQFTTAGAVTFNVPAGVSETWVTMIGGGAPGAGNPTSQNSNGDAGGGSGEYCVHMPMRVTPGGTVSGTVGAKGVGSFGAGAVQGLGTPGGDTIFGILTAQGAPILGSTGSVPGSGGGVNGATGTSPKTGTACSSQFFGGSNGGQPQSGTFSGPSQTFPGLAAGTGITPGGSGASSPWGQGGQGANTNAGNGGSAPATSYGCGGGGSSNANGANRTGGDGCAGMILVEWISI